LILQYYLDVNMLDLIISLHVRLVMFTHCQFNIVSFNYFIFIKKFIHYVT